MFYTYVLQSEADGKFYTGSTVNLKLDLSNTIKVWLILRNAGNLSDQFIMRLVSIARTPREEKSTSRPIMGKCS